MTAPTLAEALREAEAALADIGDADREPGDDVAWCERRAASALPQVRAALAAHDAASGQPASVPDGWVMVPKMFVDFVRDAPVSSGVCGCGTSMDNHSSHLSCGHSPIDQWESALASWMQKIDNAPQAVRAQPASVADGLSLIAAERNRQVSEEGWTKEHDDEHTNFELARAACCYAQMGQGGPHSHPVSGRPPLGWPWGSAWWKPSEDPVRNLTKAGALIVAEIDRLQRAAAPQPPKENGNDH